jgi:hypothetical protein
MAAVNRSFGVSKIIFGIETSDSIQSTNAIKARSSNFKPLGSILAQDGVNIIINEGASQGLTPIYADYLINNTSLVGTYVNSTSVTFNKGWAEAPSPLPANSSTNFNIFVNGVYIEPSSYTFTNNITYSTLVINPILLGYSLESNDLVIAVGKFATT